MKYFHVLFGFYNTFWEAFITKKNISHLPLGKILIINACNLRIFEKYNLQKNWLDYLPRMKWNLTTARCRSVYYRVFSDWRLLIFVIKLSLSLSIIFISHFFSYIWYSGVKFLIQCISFLGILKSQEENLYISFVFPCLNFNMHITTIWPSFT